MRRAAVVPMLLGAILLGACSKKAPETQTAPETKPAPVSKPAPQPRPYEPSSATPAAQRPDTVGAIAGQMVSARAQVVAVDQERRLVTLRDEAGDTATVKVGPEVKRLNEVKPGDYVVARYVEALALDIRKSGTGAAKMVERDTLIRVAGPRPAAIAAKVITATVEIAAIDAANKQVTIKTGSGATIPLDVTDPDVLSGLSVGDKVDVTYVEAFALSVE